MKRFLAMVILIIVVVVVVTVPFIIWGETRFAFFKDQEKSITDFLLVSLELIGLVISIAIVVFILYQYVSYRRPYRLVFEAFSNESELVETENKPLNLGILAQEELVRQFKIIYNDLKGYSDQDSQDFEVLVADELYIEEELSGNDVGKYVSADQIKKGGMIEDLKEVIRDLKDPKGINLMNLVGEIAPKEVTPFMKFIEAIFPAHVIRATGHLQSKSDRSRKVGITFEFVDLGSQRNLMVRTLRWQSSDNIEDSADTTPPAESNTANGTSTNERTDYYIELLSPAMYWVALMFWEQKLISNIPPINRILKVREKRRKARILYLIGALYYAHADQFKAYSNFFCQLAVEHFRPALIADPNWGLPYLYLANLYSFKAQAKEGELQRLRSNSESKRKDLIPTPLLSRPFQDTEELRSKYCLHEKKLLNEAFYLYDKALGIAKRKGQKFTQARIIIAKALAELTSGLNTNDEGRIGEAMREIEDMKTQIDPANYDPTRADCAGYLYNLATWYQLAYDNFIGVPNAKKEARRYLAYSLARSRSLWDWAETDEIFKSMRVEGDLEKLVQELDKKLSEKPGLAILTGKEFKIEIDPILANIDQSLGRLPDKQRT